MRFLWTIIWAFLLSFVISYVLSAMQQEPLVMSQVFVLTAVFSIAVFVLAEGGLEKRID